MFGIGAQEFIVIVLIALVLFGAPVITFIMGYSIGKRASDTSSPDAAKDTEGEEL